MTPAQTAELLAFCAAFDRRTVGKADVLAWQTVLGNLDPDAARQAVTQHYTTETRWIMPADIRAAVLANRRDRLDRHTEAEPPPGDTGDHAYRPALLAERRAIASGQTPPQPVPALPAGTSQPQTGRARAILAAVADTTTLPGPREGVVNVLAVACPICHTRPGRTCTSSRNPARRRADVHPARLEDARRVAAGQPPADRDNEQRELERRLAVSKAAVSRMKKPPEPADDFDPIYRTKPVPESDAS